ncbi:MAG: hypothetical protein ABIC95_00820 [archaeon]
MPVSKGPPHGPLKGFSRFQERRSLANIGAAFRRTPQPVMPGRISMLLTCDVEVGPSGSVQDAKKRTDRLVSFLKGYGPGTMFLDAGLVEGGKPWDLGDSEIGSHGYLHIPVGDDWWVKRDTRPMGADDVIKRSHDIIKDVYGVGPRAFRAPKFSISKSGLNTLRNVGFSIDSSMPPYNPTLLPFRLSEQGKGAGSKEGAGSSRGLVEVPVSRMPRPNIRPLPLPHLRYDSLMMGLLNDYGPDHLVDIAKDILSYWHGQKDPMLCFLCHPWEIDEHSLLNLDRFLKTLEKETKIDYISMSDYVKKAKI